MYHSYLESSIDHIEKIYTISNETYSILSDNLWMIMISFRHMYITMFYHDTAMWLRCQNIQKFRLIYHMLLLISLEKKLFYKKNSIQLKLSSFFSSQFQLRQSNDSHTLSWAISKKCLEKKWDDEIVRAFADHIFVGPPTNWYNPLLIWGWYFIDENTIKQHMPLTVRRIIPLSDRR